MVREGAWKLPQLASQYKALWCRLCSKAHTVSATLARSGTSSPEMRRPAGVLAATLAAGEVVPVPAAAAFSSSKRTACAFPAFPFIYTVSWVIKLSSLPASADSSL